MATLQITALFGEPVKQYPGQIQVTRRVKVQAPGKHFSGLTQSEQTKSYWATALEYRERYQFERHTKGWGAAHTGPGIRFICDSDAIDDPDDKGFWTTVGLWNRWRHETYQDDREAEKEYLDELPAVPDSAADPAAQKKVAPPAAIKQHFRLVGEGLHTVGGRGSLAGRQLKFVRSSSGRAARRAVRAARRSRSNRLAQPPGICSRTWTIASLPWLCSCGPPPRTHPCASGKTGLSTASTLLTSSSLTTYATCRSASGPLTTSTRLARATACWSTSKALTSGLPFHMPTRASRSWRHVPWV